MPLTQSQDAVAVPQPSSSTPPATALDGVKGVAREYARADHTHAARVQRTTMTTAADGTITWTFARPIVCPAGRVPPISYMVEDAGSPVIVQITGRVFTSDGTNDTHTALTAKAQRSQSILGLGGILLLTNLLTALGAYTPFNAAAVGVKVSLFAADPTQ